MSKRCVEKLSPIIVEQLVKPALAAMPGNAFSLASSLLLTTVEEFYLICLQKVASPRVSSISLHSALDLTFRGLSSVSHTGSYFSCQN